MNNPLFPGLVSNPTIGIIADSPSMNRMTMAKIIGFGKLREGWDFGEGSPAPQQVVRAAFLLCVFGEELGLEMDAFPGTDGDISIDYYVGDELVQILINPDMTFELTHEKGIGARYDELAHHENIRIEEILRYLMNFRTKEHASSWTSSESYTGENTSPALDGSIQIASNYIMEPCPSSKSSAFSTRRLEFASTFVDIIRPLRTENHLLSGSLVMTH